MRGRIIGFQHRSCLPALFEMTKHELDMFACAEAVCLEVAAFAVIHASIHAADRNAIRIAIFKVFHSKVGIDRMVSEVFQPEASGDGGCAPEGSLPLLERHIFGLDRMRQPFSTCFARFRGVGMCGVLHEVI